MKNFIIILFTFLLTISQIQAKDMRFIQVDGVKYSPVNEKVSGEFDNLIKKINGEKDVEFVIFTGNNILKSDEAYLKSFIKRAKKLNRPFYIVLGNKDVNRQKGLSKKDYIKLVRTRVISLGKISEPNYMFKKNDVIFIVADGSKEVIPLQSGYYKPDVLEFVDNALSGNSKRNAVIIQHFPIVPPAQKEAYYTFKADEYLKMLDNHKNVKAVIAGHFGVNNEIKRNGVVHISTAEAPVYRIIDIIDYETENPTFWSTIRD